MLVELATERLGNFLSRNRTFTANFDVKCIDFNAHDALSSGSVASSVHCVSQKKQGTILCP